MKIKSWSKALLLLLALSMLFTQMSFTVLAETEDETDVPEEELQPEAASGCDMSGWYTLGIPTVPDYLIPYLQSSSESYLGSFPGGFTAAFVAFSGLSAVAGWILVTRTYVYSGQSHSYTHYRNQFGQNIY
ncbi:hypothetical protein FACS1894105_03870 [Clostridia bacterium]|nr:hypothetical protein FACS1894105_03870 [Clostridia bacterium]